MNEKSIMHFPAFILPNQKTLFKKRAERFAQLSNSSSDKDFFLFWAHFCHAQQQSTEKFKDFSRPLSIFGAPSTPPFDRQKLLTLGLYESIIEDFFRSLLTLPLLSKAFSAIKQESLVRTQQQKDQWRLWGQNLLDQTLPPQQFAEHIFIMGALQILYSLTASQLETQSLIPQQSNLCPACNGAHSANLIIDWKLDETIKFCSCLYCGTLWSLPHNQCTFCKTTQNVSLHNIENVPDGIVLETCQACRSSCKQFNQYKNPSLDVFADDIATSTLNFSPKGSFHFASKNFNPFLAEDF